MKTLEDIRGVSGYVYVASPYSKWEDKDEAAEIITQVTAELMNDGFVAYSPICHGHAVAQYDLPLSWDFWKAQCQPMIDAAAALVVVRMEGWEESIGVTYEIEEFQRMGKPIVYYD